MTSDGKGAREGMALLTVLLLVAVLAAVAALVLDDVRFSVRRATNADLSSQAQWHAAGAERLAVGEVRRIVQAQPGRTPVDPAWNGRPFQFPLDTGGVRITVRDGQACFNLNALVDGAAGRFAAREEGVAQFVRLQRLLGISANQARRIAVSAADWIDSDDNADAAGAEDAFYGRSGAPSRTAGRLMLDPRELRPVAGMDEEAWERLRPFVCALPVAGRSPLNANTLEPRHAPLLTALTEGGLTIDGARRVIAARPARGWASSHDFWSHPALLAATVPAVAHEQVSLETRFFVYEILVDHGGTRAARSGLISVGRDGRVTAGNVRWTLAEGMGFPPSGPDVDQT